MYHEIMAAEQRGDPDAQTTINDFQDYTEYLPSDLTRSLTLIGKLDKVYIDRADKVHNLTKQYGEAPKQPPSQKPDLQALRRDISYNLDRAIMARESAYGEAFRLHEMVDRHYKRLASISAKLKALPKPPSRDPTPVPRSPQISRKTPPPRITLRVDGARHAASAGRTLGSSATTREKKRRITVPGEVLPPPNPDSPTSFTASDWESLPPSPLPMPTSRVGGSSRRSKKPVRIRPPKPPKTPKERRPRPPRAPGSGTNVHSQVAGISTSNALSLLPAPPPDAKPGSEHAPWMRLTEYEMAKLRKRMKKNAIWTPSETMIRRELADAGRGPENYRLRKAEAEEKGEDFLDVDNIADAPPGKPLQPGEISADSLGATESNLSNRGMKLNEAKKLKREAMLAASAEEMKAAANRVADLGSNFSQLFSNPPNVPLSPFSPTIKSVQKEKTPRKDKPSSKGKSKDEGSTTAQKRKRDDEPPAAPPTQQQQLSPPQQSATPKPEPIQTSTEPLVQSEKPPKKKARTMSERHSTSPNVLTETVTTTIPLAAPAVSPPKDKEKEKEKEKATRRSESKEPPPEPTMQAPEKPKSQNAASNKSSSSAAATTNTSMAPTASASRPRRISLTLKGPSEPPAPPRPPPPTAPNSARQNSERASSRAPSTRGSVGPPSATFPPREQQQQQQLQKSSHPTISTSSSTAAAAAAAGVTAPPASPAKPPATTTAASRRSKRPVPGAVVVKDQDGGATVSVGKRPHAPKKGNAKLLLTAAASAEAGKDKEGGNALQTSLTGSGAGAATAGDAGAEDAAAALAAAGSGTLLVEEIDPNEPRYCLCGDVSYGEMVGCDNDDVSLFFFSLWPCLFVSSPLFPPSFFSFPCGIF